ncbi:MAG: SDR family oxidoreductase [Burkholderiales bacterium]
MPQHRIALITGALGGIGVAIARALGEAGCDLMLNDIGDTDAHARRCRDLAAELGVKVYFNGADLSDRAQVERLVAATVETLGPIDILINNAVKRHYHSITDLPLAEWDYAVRVNLTTPFELCRLTLGGMKARGWGRIINLSSLLGLAGKAGRVDYIATKTALIGLTRAVAAETVEYSNVTCNAICPGSVLTPFIKTRIQGLADERGISFDAMAKLYRQDLNQVADFITPEQIASAIGYLCSDAARGITGINVPIDGGVSATYLQGPTAL